MSVTVERIDPIAKADVLLPFLREHVNNRMDAEGFAWQFERMPDKAIFILGHEHGVPLCTQSFLPQALMVAGVALPSVKSEHSFLLPSQRGTPVFAEAYALGMELSIAEGYGVCWGFTPAVKVWRGKLGFQVFEDAVMECSAFLGMPRLSASRSAKDILRTLRDSLRYAMSSIGRPAALGESRFAEQWPMMDEIHALHEAVNGPSCIHLRMDEIFVRWRIEQNPNIAYRCFTLRNTGRGLVGYGIIGRGRKFEPDVFHLCDAVALTRTDADRLLDQLGQVFAGPGRRLRYFGNRYNFGCQRIIDAIHRRFLATSAASPAMSFVLKETTPTLPIEAWCLNALWTQGFHR